MHWVDWMERCVLPYASSKRGKRATLGPWDEQQIITFPLFTPWVKSWAILDNRSDFQQQRDCPLFIFTDVFSFQNKVFHFAWSTILWSEFTFLAHRYPLASWMIWPDEWERRTWEIVKNNLWNDTALRITQVDQRQLEWWLDQSILSVPRLKNAAKSEGVPAYACYGHNVNHRKTSKSLTG